MRSVPHLSLLSAFFLEALRYRLSLRSWRLTVYACSISADSSGTLMDICMDRTSPAATVGCVHLGLREPLHTRAGRLLIP